MFVNNSWDKCCDAGYWCDDRWIIGLTYQPLDHHAMTEHLRSAEWGSLIQFLGTVREFTHGQQTRALHYEAYAVMAISEIRKILSDLMPIDDPGKVMVIHRLGPLQLADVAVAITVATPHREAGFFITSELMNRIKQSVPIWKQEQSADGQSTWVHPDENGIPPAPLTATDDTIPKIISPSSTQK